MSLLKDLGETTDPAITAVNGSTIKTLNYNLLSPHAKYVINKVRRQGSTKEKYWDPTRDGVTNFQNKGGDLPASTNYLEYTVLPISADYSMDYDTLSTQPGRANRSARRKGREAQALGGGDMPVFDSGAERLVSDCTNTGVFYFTPTHYVGETIDGIYYNPFFRIVGIADQFLRYGPGF